MAETLIDRVLAAKAAAEAVHASHIEAGHPLTAAQQAEILIAQVKAIIEIPPVELVEPEEKV